jgi:hypothetical protein
VEQCYAEDASACPINIPGGVQLDLVRDYLVFKSANWEHADPRYSELYPSDAS